MPHDITRDLADEAATLAFGAKLGLALTAGLIVYLHGDLGAGKTTLVRGLLQHLGHSGKIKSPTYTLVEPYLIAGTTFYHFDLYRFNDPQEWDAAGFREYFNAQSVCLVEWPEKAGDCLPQADINMALAMHDDDGKIAGRTIRLNAGTAAGSAALTRMEGT